MISLISSTSTDKVKSFRIGIASQRTSDAKQVPEVRYFRLSHRLILNSVALGSIFTELDNIVSMVIGSERWSWTLPYLGWP